jgi:hypothetical protein
MAVDTTVKIFDQFYNLNLVVNADQYEIVYLYVYVLQLHFGKFTQNIKMIVCINRKKNKTLEIMHACFLYHAGFCNRTALL